MDPPGSSHTSGEVNNTLKDTLSKGLNENLNAHDDGDLAEIMYSVLGAVTPPINRAALNGAQSEPHKNAPIISSNQLAIGE